MQSKLRLASRELQLKQQLWQWLQHHLLLSTSASPKLKLNEIVDQGCDLEVEQLPHMQLAEFRRRYVVVEGGAPTEKEEVTDAQLTCLWAKIEHGMSPFVDMDGCMGSLWRQVSKSYEVHIAAMERWPMEITRNFRGIESSGLGGGFANFSHCSTDAQLGDCSNFRPLLCLLQGEGA